MSPGWSMEQYARPHWTELANVDVDETGKFREDASLTCLLEEA